MSVATQRPPVAVVGAGIMGGGIAQLAAEAGHPVRLHDNRDGAAAGALDRLRERCERRIESGKLGRAAAAITLARIETAATLGGLADAGIVIEAVVEDLAVKRSLLRELEGIVADDCLLASNTSSLSINALAGGLRRPGRLVGMHFFNPAPVMPLVEIVSGLHTEPAIAERAFALVESWGKVAVHAASTPGFIVNRIARPFYAEALALLQERAADPATIDACLRGAGFRMGPCELMDLIGHDTNLAVTRSLFEAHYGDRRFTPSPLQRALVDGGLLGRKSGRGFFAYADALEALAGEEPAPPPGPPADAVTLHGDHACIDRFARRLAAAGVAAERVSGSDWNGLAFDGGRLCLTDGRPAGALGTRSAVFDLPLAGGDGAALAWAHGLDAEPGCRARAEAWLAALGFAPRRIEDTPGLIVARSVAMLINEAADAVQQGVCSEEDADRAMKLGVNYPAGPFEWLAGWSVGGVIALLDALADYYRGERYRVSPWLRRRGYRGPGR